MKRLTLLLLILFVGIFTTHNVYAKAPEWQLDKGHSAIYFTVDHVFSKVLGHFNEFDVRAYFSPNDLKQSSFAFTIKVDSIDTNIGKRDKHLLSGDFFDASSFPTITFESNDIMENGKGQYSVNGTLTIKGKKHPFTLPLTLAGIGDHPAKKGSVVAGLIGTKTVNRLNLGVGNGKFLKMGVVGKDVDINVSIEITKDK